MPQIVFPEALRDLSQCAAQLNPFFGMYRAQQICTHCGLHVCRLWQ